MFRRPYSNHLQSYENLTTTYEAIRAGFVSLALEKNRKATPYVAEARALQQAASEAKFPTDLMEIEGIESGLLTASGLSDKSLNHLSAQNKKDAITGLIKNFLGPAGAKFIEELVFRFLLTRGDTLGGAMRNVGGALAQKKLTRAIISTLSIAGISYRWQDSRTRKWVEKTADDADIELSLRGLSWKKGEEHRTLIYNLKVPLVRNNIDLCLFNLSPEKLNNRYDLTESYVALGELKGGIDPAGADEHWKTARAALDRIRDAFSAVGASPYIFFVGAAIEKRMAEEIWDHLEKGILSNAANLNEEKQVVSISNWLCNL
ncbi:MAG: type II restriction endonuclease [bacterium]